MTTDALSQNGVCVSRTKRVEVSCHKRYGLVSYILVTLWE